MVHSSIAKRSGCATPDGPDPARPAAPPRTPDTSGAWHLGPLPVLDNTTPWVLGDPDVLLLRRRRTFAARRVASLMVLALVVTAGVVARRDPWALGWRRATQPWVDAVTRTVPAWTLAPRLESPRG